MTAKSTRPRPVSDSSPSGKSEQFKVIVGNKKVIRRKLIGARNEIEFETADVATEEAADGVWAVPTETYIQRETGVSEVIEIRSRQIMEALSRLDQGTYGCCADCGAAIPPRRLEALPYATLCVSCQTVADRRRRA
jgi:DnaK suppressor protein